MTIILASTLLVAPACAPDSSEVVTGGSPVAAGSESELLEVRAPLVGGGSVDLSEFSGRPLALWFWAPG